MLQIEKGYPKKGGLFNKPSAVFQKGYRDKLGNSSFYPSFFCN